jgi:hypothetical protein
LGNRYRPGKALKMTGRRLDLPHGAIHRVFPGALTTRSRCVMAIGGRSRPPQDPYHWAQATKRDHPAARMRGARGQETGEKEVRIIREMLFSCLVKDTIGEDSLKSKYTIYVRLYIIYPSADFMDPCHSELP